MRYRLPRGKFYGQPLLRKDIAGLTLTETFYTPELIIDEHRSTTYGAGGVYSTLDDLYSMSQALDGVSLLSLRSQILATSPRTPAKGVDDLPETIGHGYSWLRVACTTRTSFGIPATCSDTRVRYSEFRESD